MIKDVSISGLKELNAALKQIAKEASGPEVQAAITGVAKEMKAKMQTRAHRSLKSVIIARPYTRNAKNTARSFVAIDRRIKDSKGRKIGNLANIIEFGTNPRFRKTTRQRGGGIGSLIKVASGRAGATGSMPESKTPFFRPVVNEYKGGKFLSRMTAIIKKRVERSGRRGVNL